MRRLEGTDMTLPPDLDIARSVTPKPVRDIAADMGLEVGTG